MKMPFGKYEGRHIHETPRYYLRWALATLDLSGDLKKAIQMGLQKQEWNPPACRDLDTKIHEICCSWGD
jgi:Putative quorum-sensing-regulated virulence factor